MNELQGEMKTARDMTPAESDKAREAALIWAEQGFATWKYDRCSCGERYAVLAPLCPNALKHEQWAARLARENAERIDLGTQVREGKAAA